MNDDLPFLEAIRTRPGSNTVRLVFADWLEERGDPRADLVRSQCHAAKLASSSPRRLALQDRAQALLLRHEAEWLGPMREHIGHWDFERGFIQFVSVRADTFLAHAAAWLPALPLLGVHFRKAKGHVAALAACPQLAYLNGLYLGNNDLDDADLQTLLRSPYLQRITELYLQSNHLGEAGVRALASTAKLPRLRDLNLGATVLREAGVLALANAPGLKNLRRLNLTMTFGGTEGMRALAGSDLLGRLRTLFLTCNNLPPGCLRTLAKSPAFAQMRRLHYEINEPSARDIAALASSPHATNLTALSVAGAHMFPDDGLTALAEGKALRRLQTLIVGPCQFGRAAVTALGRSRAPKALRRLHLSPDDESSQANAPYLLRGPLLRRLRDFSLSHSPIGAAGLAALASHPAPLRLWEFDVTLKKGQAPAWEALLARGTLRHLTKLTVCAMPPGSLRALLAPDRLPQLRRLKIYGPPLDTAEFQRFLKSPLMGRLQHFSLTPRRDRMGRDIKAAKLLELLLKAKTTTALTSLGLDWSLSPDQVGMLTAQGRWPALTNLDLGSFAMGPVGAKDLAAWPLLEQLRFLNLRNSSFQEIPGLDALADSPHLGQLLRIQLNNASVAPEARAALRRRLSARFAPHGRNWPRTVSIGGWDRLDGDDD